MNLITSLDLREINYALLEIMNQVHSQGGRSNQGSARTSLPGAEIVSIPTASSVASVFGRIGDVTSQKGDYHVDQITVAAPINSPSSQVFQRPNTR